MKIPSTYLYDLVKTLSKTEKRYIKVKASSGHKDYIQLMDALIAQKKFNEAELIKNNQGVNFIKHLAVNKRYLFDLILQSLTRFNQENLADKIIQKINGANVLMEKGLFSAALKEVRKGQKIAHTYEFFELQIMLLSIEKRLLTQRQFKTQDNDATHRIYKEEVNCIEQLKNTNEYWYLHQQVAQFQIKFQKIQTATQQEYIKDHIQSPEFNNIDLAKNLRSKLYFYQANATYQFMLGDVTKAYEINGEFLSLLETSPHFLRLFAERYLATLNNMLIDSLITGKYDALKKGIKRLDMTLLRPEFKSIKNIEARVFRQRYLLLINWSLSQNDFKKALEYIPAIEEGLDRFKKQIEKHHRVTFHYLTAYILFQNNNYDEALKWNNMLLNEAKEDVVKEIFYFARVLNLIIHYELGNYTLLESLLLSTPKYLRARRPIYATEKAVFRFLGKLLNSINDSEKQKLIASFKTKIDELFKLPSEKRVFNYLDLRLWFK